MASVNISEKEFHAVAAAANDALDKNEVETAYTLDDLARKMNTALSVASARREIGNFPLRTGRFTEFRIESPLESNGRRPKK